MLEGSRGKDGGVSRKFVFSSDEKVFETNLKTIF